MNLTAPKLTAFASAAILIFALTGCGADSDPVGPGEVSEVLAEHDLDGLDTEELIDRLDRLGGSDRPTDLMASVRPDTLVLTAGAEEQALAMPEDRFYLSFAPYVDQTHDCFNHSLTTCQGEVVSEEVQVEVADHTNDTVLVDDVVSTFENGFVGLWLPRDIEGTIRVTYEGKTGEVDFSTDAEAPTCLTTLKLT